MIETRNIPRGKIERQICDVQFIPTAALPAGVVEVFASGGTTAVATLGAASYYYASITNNSTATQTAFGIRTAYDINISNWSMVRVDVSGFHFNTSGMSPGLNICNTAKTNGVSVWCPAATPDRLTMRFFGDAGDLTINYDWGAPGQGDKRNIGLMIYPPTKEFFVMVEDQVVYHVKRPNAVLGLSRFFIESNKPTAAASTDHIRLARFRAVGQHN